MIRLGVNVDHVATLRQARGEEYPNPLAAALTAQAAGAANITCHLREDRRHIQDADVFAIRSAVHIPLNFEMAVTDEMVAIALRLKPHSVTLVPEKRMERTTEGGLARQAIEELAPVCKKFKYHGIRPLLFIEPAAADVESAVKAGAFGVEFHTGQFCRELYAGPSRAQGLAVTEGLAVVCRRAKQNGLAVHVGHGLNYQNAHWLQLIPEVEEANIGHAIVAHALFTGFHQAVREMFDRLNAPQHRP